MSVGKNLRRLRAKTKFSQQEIADYLEVDRITYSKLENETSDVKSQYVPKLAEIFNVKISELFKDGEKNQVDDNVENKDKAERIGLQKEKVIINIINLNNENSAIKLKEEIEKILNNQK